MVIHVYTPPSTRYTVSKICGYRVGIDDFNFFSVEYPLYLKNPLNLRTPMSECFHVVKKVFGFRPNAQACDLAFLLFKDMMWIKDFVKTKIP